MSAADPTLSPPAPPWHAAPPAEALRRLATDPDRGLDPAEVERRRAEHGANVLVEGARRGPLRMLAAQFTDAMVLVLVAAAVVAAALGEPEDAVAIAVIVLLNGVLGFVQEFRAHRAMQALKALAAPVARVLRAGRAGQVPAVDLVPGDVVLLDAGSMVPADLRLLEAAELRVDESALTGESVAVDKAVSAEGAAEAVALGDRRTMAYKGTLVTYGRGVGLVVATGMGTELGRIASMLHEGEDVVTPLQRRLARFGRGLALAVLAICAVVFVTGLLRGEEPLRMFLTALSLAVAAIPEALPAVVTVALALGAGRMARRNALVRRLPAVETLGSVTWVCTDKTGTLTLNRMRVEAVDVGDGTRSPPVGDGPVSEPLRTLLDALAVSHDAVRDAEGRATGDPTEVALLEAAEAAGRGKDQVLATLPRIGEVPFGSERARMSTLHRTPSGSVVFTKGAAERVLEVCVARLGADGLEPLDRAAWLARAEALARGGHRTLAVATRELEQVPERVGAEEIERDLVLVGLVALLDPPRPEAADAIARCHEAGMRVVMITGDHPATAGAIARTLGLASDGDEVLTGPELARLPDEEFARRVENVRVYARAAPEQKIRIVEALQARGEFVAMTGDGVNDAPALARADIGVAMGKGGTDVAREAAHLVLLDDHFATIVAAVEEGRRIYDNLRKFVRYALTGNGGEIWVLFLAPFLGLPIPLLPIHILWVNLVTDGLPGLALAVERAEPDVMSRPPRPPGESIFAHGLWQHAVWVGLLIAALTLGTQAWAWRTGSAHWQTMTFTVLAFSQMAHVLAIRSERRSLLEIGPFTNLPLLGAVALTCLLQLATIYVPALHPIFETEALTLRELVACVAVSSTVFFAVELEKAAARRGWLYGRRSS